MRHTSTGSLSVVLPAYNEESNISNTLRDVIETLDSGHLLYEIIVVDDGSNDGTGAAAARFASDSVRVIEHSSNKGYGTALRSGFSAATGDYIFFMDSDGQFRMSEFFKLAAVLQRGQAVLGYRENRRDSLLRRLNGRAWTALVNSIFHLGVEDIDCAFKLLPARPVQSLSLRTSGAMINTELLVKLRANGVKWIQVPVRHYPRLAGEQSGNALGVVFQAFRELIGFWWSCREC